MQFLALGRSGLKVPPLAIGSASFGDAAQGSWHVGEAGAEMIVRHAVDRGAVFFDTASSYADGLAEARLGRILQRLGVQDDVLVATKVFFPTGPSPNDRGLSRRHVLRCVDASLARIGRDYLDLLMIHRWDAGTPIEETLAVLDDLVRSGRVRYLGASSMSAWRLMKALALQRADQLAPFVAMQGHYNLLYREEEREMIPLCREEGLGYLAWSPLARGVLAGEGADARRLRDDPFVRQRYCDDLDAPVLEVLAAAAGREKVAPAILALGWLRAKGAIPVIGASRPAEIDVALEAIARPLGERMVAELEREYRPHPILGFDPASERIDDR